MKTENFLPYLKVQNSTCLRSLALPTFKTSKPALRRKAPDFLQLVSTVCFIVLDYRLGALINKVDKTLVLPNYVAMQLRRRFFKLTYDFINRSKLIRQRN